MIKILNRIMPGMLVAFGVLLLACLGSCKQNHITYSTTSTVNMYTYLDQNPDQFSLFKQIVDKAGYSSFLNTYGTYTLFASTNDGVNKYLKATNKANVDAIDVATAKQIVAISLIADTLNTTVFTDGKMRSPTTSGQYLITSASNTNGVTNILINKQANLLKGNVKLGNGLIHVIDNVLIAASLTLAQTVEQNTKYSIFTAALKATGFYDTLNVAATANTVINRKYMTLIAESDSTLKAAGFADFNALKTKYSTKGDPKNHADSLWLYVAYHVWPELSYLSDIAASSTHGTLAPLEITTSELVGQTVLLNNDTFNGILEPGQPLYRPLSDVSATNGVMHTVLTTYKIKIRFPSPIYFDVCDQPEFKRTPGLYRVPGKSLAFLIGSLQNVIFLEAGTGTAGNSVTYTTDSAVPANYYFNNDWLVCGQRFRTGNNGLNSIDFLTPVIVKGRYKIWVDYKFTNAQTIISTFDGQTLPNIFSPGDRLNAAETDAQAEVRGFKSYSDSPITSSTTSPYNNHVGRLLGVVNITTTDRHRIKFVSTAGSGSAVSLNLDVIEFRPVDMDQIHPRLGRNGTLVP